MKFFKKKESVLSKGRFPKPEKGSGLSGYISRTQMRKLMLSPKAGVIIHHRREVIVEVK
jgi:hypothetical protein